MIVIKRSFILVSMIYMLLISLFNRPDWEIIHWQDFDLVLEGVMGNERYHNPFALSPDATLLAWISPNDGLCFVTFNSYERQCHPMPQGLVSNRLYNALQWSPDQAYLAINRDSSYEAQPAGLWFYSLKTQTFQQIIKATTHNTTYFPLWDSANQRLYFLQHEREKVNDVWVDTAGLYAYSLENRELKFLVELPEALAASYPALAASSPDGQQLAITASQAPLNGQVDTTGLWLIDQNNQAITHAATMADLTVGRPDNEEGGFWLASVKWTESGLFIRLTASPFNILKLMVTHFDPATGRSTPLFDFSGVTVSFDDYSNYPQYGSMTRDGKFLFYTTLQEEGSQLWLLPLPPDGSDPALIKDHLRLDCGSNHYLVTVGYEGETVTSLLQFNVGCGE